MSIYKIFADKGRKRTSKIFYSLNWNSNKNFMFYLYRISAFVFEYKFTFPQLTHLQFEQSERKDCTTTPQL